jgi:hypothetical protein
LKSREWGRVGELTELLMLFWSPEKKLLDRTVGADLESSEKTA